MHAVYLLTIGLFLLGSCQSPRQGQATSSNAAMQDVYRCTVSFISIGSGIDKVARQNFLSLIARYKNKTGKDIVFHSVSWGREGETDYCLRLAELSAEQQERFISELRDVLNSSTRVRVTENSTCRE